MPTYEMFWKCGQCGTDQLLGKTHRCCPSCGAAQDPASRYFPPEDQQIAVEDHPYVGVDWRCERCDTANSNAAKRCVGCGDARDGVEKEVGRVTEAPPKPAAKPVKPAAKSEEPAEGPPGRSKLPLVGALVLGALVLLLVAVCGLLSWREAGSFEVTGHRWERTIAVQELKLEQDGAWCDSVPIGADVRQRTTKVRSHESVPDGETCRTVKVDQGDGTFRTDEKCTPKTKQVDVKDDWCTYDVERWSTVRTARAAGEALTPAPAWPETRVTACAALGCQREGAREATYTLRLRDEEAAETSCTLDEPAWRAKAVGSRWTGTRRVLGGQVDCASLTAAP